MMVFNRKLLLTIFAAILLFACSDKNVTAYELVQYIQSPSSGLVKQKKIGNIEMKCLYKPLDFMIADRLRKNQISKEEYDKEATQLGGLDHFNLQISVATKGLNVTNVGTNDFVEQQNRLYYLSYHFKNDIQLISGSDTLKPVLYHFERNFDVAEHRTFVLAFPKDNEEVNDKTLVVNSDFLKTGPVKIKIKKEDILKAPALKIL